MENNLILRGLTSPYGDNTRGSVLNHEDVDGNFIYLKGNLIKSGTTQNNNLLLQSLNGEIVTIPINITGTTTGGTGGSGVGISALTFDTNNTLTITDSTGGTFTALVNYLSGLTITGSMLNGTGVTATGNYSHAEGSGTTSSGQGSHSEGFDNTAQGFGSHAEGQSNTASGTTSHAEGAGTISGGDYSHTEGANTRTTGIFSHAEGNNNTAFGSWSHVEGTSNRAFGVGSHAEGGNTIAIGDQSHAEGAGTTSNGIFSHTEGDASVANGGYSHAEGASTIANGTHSHAEGIQTATNANYSHAEGFNSITTALYSHAEGTGTTANGIASHSEGKTTQANGMFSHAEGNNTISAGDYSHSEGSGTTASGLGSHVEGLGTIAAGDFQHVQGRYNTLNNTTPLMIIGDGTSNSNRSDLALFYSTGITFNQSLSATTISASTYYGDGSNLTGIPTIEFKDIAYVDQQFGNNLTGSLNKPSKPFSTIDAVLDVVSISGGCKIIISRGNYATPTKSKIKSNLWFCGSGMPIYNDTNTVNGLFNISTSAITKMSGGTILHGFFDVPYNVNNIKCTDFGVDNGKEWIDVNNSGTPLDCLAFAQDYGPGLDSADGFHRLQTSTKPRTGIVVQRVSVLAYEPSSLIHGFIFENMINPSVTDIYSCYGFAGIVIKTIGGVYQNLHARAHSDAGIYVKSNDYSFCYGVVVDGFEITSLGSYDGGGLHLNANDSGSPGLYECSIANGMITQTKYGVKSMGSVLDGIHLENVKVALTQGDGFNFPNLFYSLINNCNARACGGDGFNIRNGGLGKGPFISNCLSASNGGDGFDIGGSQRIELENTYTEDNSGYGINSINSNLYIGLHTDIDNSAGSTNGTLNTKLTVDVGGTGILSTTPYALLAGGTTSTGALQQIAGLGVSGQTLVSNGAGALPTWQNNVGGGAPGGSNTQVQFNDSGVFNGDAGFTYSSGNVGIGIASALAPLHVNGNLRLSDVMEFRKRITGGYDIMGYHGLNDAHFLNEFYPGSITKDNIFGFWTNTLISGAGNGEALYINKINSGNIEFANHKEGSGTLRDMVFSLNGFGSNLITFKAVTGNAIFGTTNAIVGTVTNNDAIAGNIGESIESYVSTYTNYTTTATYQNIASITLTAGDWDISAQGTFSSNGATITAASDAIFLIGTATASATGATEGKNIFYIPQAALLSTSHESASIAPYRISISASTTYYLNTQSTFTIGNPQFVGGIRARRMR